MKYDRLEIRYCVQPQELLGWMDVDPDARSISFPIELPIIPITDGIQKPYWVIMADGLPIETLRKLPGFIEKNEPPCN